MTISPNASNESNYAAELYPNIAAVASVYGDLDGTYAAFLSQAERQFAQEAFYLWDQPFAEKEGLTLGPGNSAKNATNDSGTTPRTVTHYGLVTLIWGFVYLLI
jgi:hypothetical protein